jgi:uncharacterized membrane protein
MTAQWRRLEAAEAPSQGPMFMDAVLTPNRSLSGRVFLILFGVFCALNLMMGLAFWSLGAWPVIGFLGLDVLLLYIAFRVNYRDGRASERVQVSPDRLQLTRTDARGATLQWGVHPAWARVETTPEAVFVHAGGSRQHMAAFLSPPERDDFSAALAAAIARARAYRPSTSEME